MTARAALLVWLAGAGLAAAQDAPLSAIDWLSDSVSAPPVPAAMTPEPPVTQSAAPEVIVVTPLDSPIPDTVGLADAQDVGLGADIWARSTTQVLARQLSEMRPPRRSAMQVLLHDMLRVRADAPRDSTGGIAFFLARIDALLATGRFDIAQDLMAQAGSEEPHIFRRWFDVTLLTGGETRACARMRALPEITPTYPARIFCLARSGDWPAAVVTLETARALGVITPAETERLTRFLDDRSEGGLLPPPARPTPLDFYLYEAMGEPMGTTRLPLPFAHADLRQNGGWKARIEAAERLARAGAIDGDRLWAIYAERMPAASGQLWDRVERVQRLDSAMRTGDPNAVSSVLPAGWAAMSDAGLLAVLAGRYAERLIRLPLSDAAAGIAAQAAALTGIGGDGLDGALADLARGVVPPVDDTDPGVMAIVAGLTDAPPPATAALIEDGRVGEALLHAIRLVEEGGAGNLDALTDGLSILRAADQEARAFAVAVENLVVGPAR